MPLKSPCSDAAMGCGDLATCSLTDLGDVVAPDPCKEGWYLRCKGDGTFDFFDPPAMHIGTTSVTQVIPAGGKVLVANLATDYFDNYGMKSGNSGVIKEPGFYEVQGNVYVEPTVKGWAQLSIMLNGFQAGQDTTPMEPGLAWNDFALLAKNQYMAKVGDTIGLEIHNDSAGSVTITVSSLYIRWVRPKK